MALHLKEICRLCGKTEMKMQNIFTIIRNEVNMSDIILKYFGFSVSHEDLFPKLICEGCTKTIQSFDDFVDQCLIVQKFLLKLSAGDPEAVHNDGFKNIIKSELQMPLFESNTITVEIENSVKDEEVLVKQEVTDLEDMDDALSNSFFDEGLDYPVSDLLATRKSHSKKRLKASKKKKSSSKSLAKIKTKHRTASDDDAADRSDRKKSDPNLRNYFKFGCYVCKLNYTNWFRLKAHIVQDHKLPAKVECVCGCVVKSKTAIYRHVAGHNDPTSYACDECSRITKTQEALERHKMRHIPKPERVYSCSGCSKMFNSKENLKSHERVHIPVYERYNYPCTICGNKFTTKSAVVGHTRAVHEKIKRYICDICGYACSTGGELIQHRAIHSDEKLFPCTRCPKKFKTGSNLKAHLDTHDSTSYPCNMCDKVLNSRRTLRKHLLVHDDQCRHVCSFCNKAFKRRQTLKVHLTSHTGDTPVQCPWCPQKFAYSSACRTHKQRCHPNELAMQSQTSLHNVQNMSVMPTHFEPNCCDGSESKQLLKLE